MTTVASSDQVRSLDEQRREFAHRRFLAMPLAGTIAWAMVALLTPLYGRGGKMLVLYIATGCIFYLGALFSRFTGEHFFAKDRPKNTFDRLFLCTVAMSLLVFAIAIPFARVDYTSLPLTVGILSGLMWLPFSWMIEHWVGLFHAVSRTILVSAAWHLFPAARYVVVPLVIVALYVVTIIVLERRWRARQHR
jgi:hypothetical protein